MKEIKAYIRNSMVNRAVRISDGSEGEQIFQTEADS